MLKTFEVPIFVSWNKPQNYNPEADYTEQSLRIMDVPGYIMFKNDARYGGVAHIDGTIRTAIIQGSNRETVRKQVQQALGEYYYQGVNAVNYA